MNRTTRLHLILLSFLTLGLLAGCSGPSAVVAPGGALPELFPSHSVDQIGVAMSSSIGDLQAIRTKSSVTVSSPDGGLSLNATIQYRKADSLYASFSPGLIGIEVARAAATADSFYVYDRIKRRLFVGDEDAALEALPVPLTFEDLFANISGSVVPDRAARWTVSPDSASYILMTDDKRQRLTVDPIVWRATSAEHLSPSGEVEILISYSEFQEFEGRIFPRRIVIETPATGDKINIFHRGIEVNPDDLEFAFKPGKINETIVLPQ